MASVQDASYLWDIGIPPAFQGITHGPVQLCEYGLFGTCAYGTLVCQVCIIGDVLCQEYPGCAGVCSMSFFMEGVLLMLMAHWVCVRCSCSIHLCLCVIFTGSFVLIFICTMDASIIARCCSCKCMVSHILGSGSGICGSTAVGTVAADCRCGSQVCVGHQHVHGYSPVRSINTNMTVHGDNALSEQETPKSNTLLVVDSSIIFSVSSTSSVPLEPTPLQHEEAVALSMSSSLIGVILSIASIMSHKTPLTATLIEPQLTSEHPPTHAPGSHSSLTPSSLLTQHVHLDRVPGTIYIVIHSVH